MSQDISLENVYKQFGRDTPAGRMLFNLYNPKGNRYVPPVHVKRSSKQKRLNPEEERRAKIRKKYLEVQRRKNLVKVPKRKKIRQVVHPIDMLRGRKSRSVINAEMKKQYPNVSKYRKTPYKPVESRQSKIKKLQSANQNKNKNKHKPKKKKKTKPKGPTSLLQEYKQMFETILQEIDDRKAFLDRMTQLGQGKKYASQIRGEIADRVKELQKLDALIAKADDEAIALKTKQITKSKKK